MQNDTKRSKLLSNLIKIALPRQAKWQKICKDSAKIYIKRLLTGSFSKRHLVNMA